MGTARHELSRLLRIALFSFSLSFRRLLGASLRRAAREPPLLAQPARGEYGTVELSLELLFPFFYTARALLAPRCDPKPDSGLVDVTRAFLAERVPRVIFLF